MTPYTTLKELAEELETDRSRLLKYVKKNELEFVKLRTRESGGQLCVAFSRDQAEQVRDRRRRDGFFPLGLPV